MRYYAVHCAYTAWLSSQAGVGRRGRRPLQLLATFYRRKIATLFAGFTLFIWIGKAVQRFFLRHRFIVSFTFVCFFTFLHRLVGCRRMRLCLKLRQGFALYPQGTLSLDPASPLTPGPRLRFISRYARCCFFTLCLFFSLVSFAHSSLLIPHFTRFTA